MVVLGLLLGLVGTDIYTGTPRFTFGITAYADGLNFVALAVGMFGIAEILKNLEGQQDRTVIGTKLGALWPTREEFRRMMPPVFRGTALGSALGILPGGGAIWPPLPPTRWRSGSRRRRRSSGRAPSKASPDRSPRTMPARRPASSRC